MSASSVTIKEHTAVMEKLGYRLYKKFKGTPVLTPHSNFGRVVNRALKEGYKKVEYIVAEKVGQYDHQIAVYVKGDKK